MATWHQKWHPIWSLRVDDLLLVFFTVPSVRCWVPEGVFLVFWCSFVVVDHGSVKIPIKMGVSTNRGSPKWMVKIMEKLDDLGWYPTIFGNIQIDDLLLVFFTVPSVRCWVPEGVFLVFWCSFVVVDHGSVKIPIKMGVSTNRGSPKWMVKIMEKLDDLGWYPTIFGNIQIDDLLLVFLHGPLSAMLSPRRSLFGFLMFIRRCGSWVSENSNQNGCFHK